MNLNHLAIFHAVAGARSVTRGAEALAISQPAASKQIKLLETQLGVVLVEKLGRGIRLTDEGETLFQHSINIFSAVDRASQSMRDLSSLKAGSVRVGATPTVGVYLLPDILVAFRRRYAEVNVSLEVLSLKSLIARLAEGSLDLAVTEMSVDRPNLASEQISSGDLVPIASSTNPILDKQKVSMSDFTKQPFVARDVGNGNRSYVERELAGRGYPVTPTISLNSTEAIKRAVAAGMGVGVVHRLAIQLELAAGVLKIIKVRGWSMHRPISLVRRSNGYESRATKAFVETLVG